MVSEKRRAYEKEYRRTHVDYYKVYEECIKKGVTHESLCKHCNIVSNTLRMYLLLEWNINAKDLVHIAEALNMDPCELFESYILALKEKEAGNENSCNDRG